MPDQSKKLIVDVLQELEVNDKVVSAFESAKLQFVSQLGKTRADATATIKKVAPGNDTVLKGLLAAWDSENSAADGGGSPQKKTIEQVLTSLVAAGKCTSDAKQKLQPEFASRKIVALNDLGTNKAAVETKLREVFSAGGLASNTDLKNELVNAWLAENPTGAPGKADAPMEEPKASTVVPPGKIDLSTFPRLNAEHEGKMTLFELPAQYLSQSGGKYLAAGDLADWQWMFLANNLTLTKAFDLRRTLFPGNTDPFATRAAFVWEKKGGFRNDIVGADTYDEALTAVTIEESHLHSNMMVGGSLSGGFAFCPGGITPCYMEASLKVQATIDKQSSQYAKRVYSHARFRRDKARLVLENCLSLAPEFEYILGVAFEKFTGKDVELFDALEQIFDEFGHYVPSTVTLGGVMYFETDIVSIEGQTTDRIQESLKSAVKFKAGDTASGAIEVGYDNDTYTKLNAEQFSRKYQMATKGGDDALNGQPGLWRPTVDDSRTWKVIAREGVTPISRILYRSRLDLHKALEDAIKRKRMAAWGVGDPKALPVDWDFPPFPLGHLVTLSSMFGRESQNDRSFLVAENGSRDQPDDGALSEGKNIFGQSYPPTSPLREVDSYYANCQSAPLRSTRYAFGNDPAQNKLLWKFEYLQKGPTDYEPRFLIVSSDGQWVLSAFYIPDYAAFASLYPYSEEVKRSEKTTPAQWILRAALEVGKVKMPDERSKWSPGAPLPAARGYFRLYNPYYNGYLADEAVLNAHRRFARTEEVVVYTPGMGYGAVNPGLRKNVQVINCSLFGNSEAREEGGTWKKRADLVQMRRTMLRVDAAPKAATVPAADTDIVAYKNQCWFIRDWADPAPRVVFDELAQLDKWVADRRAAMPKSVLKA